VYGKFNLGRAYEIGISVTQDYEKAYKWYYDASENGHSGASYKLALFYHNGWGVIKDHGMVVVYIRESAEQGYDKAQLNLANALVSGNLWGDDFGSVDYEKARLWYEKAAQQGNMSAKKKSCFYAYIW
jgi:hypothetical protein